MAHSFAPHSEQDRAALEKLYTSKTKRRWLTAWSAYRRLNARAVGSRIDRNRVVYAAATAVRPVPRGCGRNKLAGSHLPYPSNPNMTGSAERLMVHQTAGSAW